MHLKLFFFTLHIFNLFYPEINKPNIHNNIIDISSFQNGLNDLFSSTGFYLRGKKYVFKFLDTSSQNAHFEVVTFFFHALWLSNQLSFSVVVDIYKICIFDEAFLLLTIRIPIITKFFRVVTCCKDLSPIYMHEISTEWSCRVTWHIKYTSLPEEDVSIPH